MSHFVSGAISMGYAIAALFFVRFWRSTHDRLFALFASAFALLALHRLALIVLEDQAEHQPLAYVGRLLAYLLILFAILDKNRAR